MRIFHDRSAYIYIYISNFTLGRRACIVSSWWFFQIDVLDKKVPASIPQIWRQHGFFFLPKHQKASNIEALKSCSWTRYVTTCEMFVKVIGHRYRHWVEPKGNLYICDRGNRIHFMPYADEKLSYRHFNYIYIYIFWDTLHCLFWLDHMVCAWWRKGV